MTRRPLTTLAPRRTAIRRAGLSAPLRAAIGAGVLARGMTVLDYGCGQGGDVAWLTATGWTAQGWDPVWRPQPPPAEADLVYLGYVLNVIVRPAVREETLRAAWALARRRLVVAVRVGDGPGRRFNDGRLTSAGTFQRYWRPGEAAGWCGQVLGVTAAPLGPGTFWLERTGKVLKSAGIAAE